jgi:hypothetical protein
MFGTILALPPGLRADDATAPAKPAPSAAEAPPAPKQTASPLFLKSSRLYIGRIAPVDATDGAAPPPALDLELKPEDVQWLLKQMPYKADDEDPGTVEVTGQYDTPGPDVPANPFASMWWAVKNPKQAWRIFAPIQ